MNWFPTLLILLFFNQGTSKGEEVKATHVEVVQVPFLAIHPTQQNVGMRVVQAIHDSKYNDVVDEKSLHKKLEEHKAMRAVRGPHGVIFLTDGHHRTTAAFLAAKRICKEDLECMNRAKANVKIEADYSNRTWEDFANFMFQNNNIYLASDIRARIETGETTKAAVLRGDAEILPLNLDELGNDPMRSSISELFNKQKPKIDGDHFKNYLEFYLAEKISNQVESIPGHEFDADLIAKLKLVIFEDRANLLFLRCFARTDAENWTKAQNQIDAVLGIKRDEKNPEFQLEECEM
jgi:hypothetical protein